MLGSKRQKKENYFDKVKIEHTKYFNPENQKEYANIEKTYKFLKESYIEKILNKEIDIEIELLRLKKSCGKLNGDLLGYNIFFIIGIMGAMIPLIMQEGLKFLNSKYAIYNVMFLIIVLVMAFRSVGKEVEKDRPRNFMLALSIKVLEDIEKKIAQKEVRLKEEVVELEKQKRIEQYMNRGKLFKRKFIQTNSQDEVAATTQNGNTDKKNDKDLRNVGNLNGFINIVFYKKFNNKK